MLWLNVLAPMCLIPLLEGLLLSGVTTAQLHIGLKHIPHHSCTVHCLQYAICMAEPSVEQRQGSQHTRNTRSMNSSTPLASHPNLTSLYGCEFYHMTSAETHEPEYQRRTKKAKSSGRQHGIANCTMAEPKCGMFQFRSDAEHWL